MEAAVQAVTLPAIRPRPANPASAHVALCATALVLLSLPAPAFSQDGGAPDTPTAAGSSASTAVRPNAAEAARIMSAGDRVFRQGRIDRAVATFRTLKSFFPNWWIPGAKYIVARRQAGMKIDSVISGLESMVELEPTGDYLPMLLTLAAGERLSSVDIEHLRKLHLAEMAKPRAEPDFRTKRLNGDLDSRYQFARATALEAAGLFDEAEAEYRYLIEYRPFAITPRVRLAALLRARGRPDEAARILDGIEGSSLLPSRIRIMKNPR